MTDMPGTTSNDNLMNLAKLLNDCSARTTRQGKGGHRCFRRRQFDRRRRFCAGNTLTLEQFGEVCECERAVYVCTEGALSLKQNSGIRRCRLRTSVCQREGAKRR